MSSRSLITGHAYTLAELLCGERRIVVPDLQRDYCWGGRGTLVADFVESLIAQCEQGNEEELHLGLVYGYEAPPNHLQLCDGQQRLTTLFLLLGLLHRHGADLAHLLRLPSGEPRLHYAIREQSLYFINDLVDRYFIGKETAIKGAPWWYASYESDPSIRSMLLAIDTVEHAITRLPATSLPDIAHRLTTRLTFIYYDLCNRTNGEETFVVINTTGEPLTAAQNLKPLIVSQSANPALASQQWEEMETWFWQHRQGDNDTADAGFEEFLAWVSTLTGRCDDLLSVYAHWQRVRFLFDDWTDAVALAPYLLSPSKGSARLIDRFVVLPTLAYLMEPGRTAGRNLLRLHRWVHNLTRLPGVGKAVSVLTSEVISAARQCTDPVELLALSISDTVITPAARLPHRILSRLGEDDRKRTEELFWQAQDSSIWNGQIGCLIEWAGGEECFSIDSFEHYRTRCEELFLDATDLLRRALLTFGLNGYPRVLEGYQNLCFVCKPEHWRIVFEDNLCAVKAFIDSRLDHATMIANSAHTGPWANIVHCPDMLAYCRQKNVRRDERLGLLLIREKNIRRFVSEHNLLLHLALGKRQLPRAWEAWVYDQETSCSVLENCETQQVVDTWWDSGQWRYRTFVRGQQPSSEAPEATLLPHLDASPDEAADALLLLLVP